MMASSREASDSEKKDGLSKAVGPQIPSVNKRLGEER